MCSSPRRSSSSEPKQAPIPALEAAAPAPPPEPKAPTPAQAPKAVGAPVAQQPMGISGARKKNAPKAKRSTGSLRGGGGSINASAGSGVNI